MGNKLSCSCAPLIKKAGYRYEDSPWNPARRRDGHLLRLWAEVFHVSSSGAGTVKWQQVSEDLVPVNITCIQDTPECVFHITAYNSQVDKILDVRLIQPGTRIGQASECFVYWKDPATNDTWGLNFTSPIDAKQFRECCSPSFKFSRKASSSYSLKLEPVRGGSAGGGSGKTKGRRKPVSTPASPSRATREPQCTCMTAEQYARLRAQDPRYRGTSGASTLPRTQGRSGEVEGRTGQTTTTAANHGTAVHTSSATPTTQASMYDSVAGRRTTDSYSTMKMQQGRDPRQPPSHHTSHASLHHKAGTLPRKDEVITANGRGVAAGGEANTARDNRSLRGSRRELSSKSVDYSEMDQVREGDTLRRRMRSKSTDDVTKGNNSDFETNEGGIVADTNSPTNQLLKEYEMHLRNTLAKGMDAESYSLHTFEALLTQSMENL
ncbi:unnamed protein product, partial [Meganyctiphanes norvegica]